MGVSVVLNGSQEKPNFLNAAWILLKAFIHLLLVKVLWSVLGRGPQRPPPRSAMEGHQDNIPLSSWYQLPAPANRRRQSQPHCPEAMSHWLVKKLL